MFFTYIAGYNTSTSTLRLGIDRLVKRPAKGQRERAMVMVMAKVMVVGVVMKGRPRGW